MRPLSFSLVGEPWIETVDAQRRPRLLSAAQALDNADSVFLATTDPLLRAATLRLLTALAYAAGCGPRTRAAYHRQVAGGVDLAAAAAWTRAHHAHLDLFDPERPFFQDASLHALSSTPEAVQPVLYLDMTAAIGRPLLADDRHLLASRPVAFRRAAELVLVQQMWAVGGRIAVPSALFGPRSNFGSPAQACGNVVWQPAGTLAQQLAWQLTPVPDGPGTPQWTYRPRGAPGQRLLPDSECDALTWHPRRILLLPDTDGHVTRVLFAQGWIQARPEPGSASAFPGNRDQAYTDDGRSLDAARITGDDDLAPLLESWSYAPEGSWSRTVQDAARATGRFPDVTATALAANKKKLLFRREVTLPGDLLADARVTTAARDVMDVRRTLGRLSPGRLNDAYKDATLGTTVPPGFGSDLLHDPSFLAVSRPRRIAALTRLVHGAHPAAPLRRAGRTAAIVRAVSLIESPPAPVPRPEPADDTQEFTLFPLSDLAAATTAASGLPDSDMPDDSTDDPLWDDDLFTTADTGAPAAPADAESDPGMNLARQVGRWAANPHRRDLITALAAHAVRPAPHTSAVARITLLVPPEHQEAGALTAALLAYHHSISPRGPIYGSTPLPRLMRAFGSGRGYGPDHRDTKNALDRMVRTQHPGQLRPHLVRTVRYAARHGLVPYWPGLFDDLAGWDHTVRSRWAALFYTARPTSPKN
ncbi:type I-E CRISPR-associated protein Cse1/CasA [Streptomyces sp. NPDC005538]|uniref:type I-E CRISPR-associated protein Cse1/CasA n=1 Tax=Streptomyces sp. NPDC005538 TaxID=3157043 RepID=UPI0033B78A3E